MTRGAWLRLAGGLVVSAVLVWLAYRGIDLGDIGRRIASAKPADFALSVAAFLAASLLRSRRWQLCFERSDDVSFGQAFGAYGLGALSTQAIPARLGDLVRVYVLGRNSGVSKSKGLGTLVVERLSDLFTVVILLGILLPMFALPGWIKVGDAFAAIVAFVALGLVYGLARKGTTLTQPAWVVRRRPLHVLFRLLVQLIQGFSAVKSARRGLLILLTSFGIWFFQVAVYVATASALQLPLGWKESALVTGVLALATIIPAGPGYAGSFELVAVSTLALFNIDREAAISYVNLTRVAAFIALLIWGAAALPALRLARRRDMAPSPAPERTATLAQEPAA